jgi:predicted CoA-binding protein
MNNKNSKKTLVLGASEKVDRYSNKAVRLLLEYGHPVIAHGLRNGKIKDVEILTEKPQDKDIHTVTLYLGPQNQVGYYDYLVGLQPKRVIFNPGTENPVLKQKLVQSYIEVVEYCTLVMLKHEMF